MADTEETKVERAVRLRLAYDEAIANRFHEADPVDVVGRAAGAWLDAENALDNVGYLDYQNIYQAKKGQTS